MKPNTAISYRNKRAAPHPAPQLKEEVSGIPHKPLDKWSACLVRLQQSQSRADFTLLFAHFAPRIKSYLLRSGASNGQAEEAAQEAMATLWIKAHMFNPAKATASTWIFTIARNKQLDAIRKQNRPLPDLRDMVDDYADDAAGEFARMQEQDLLHSAIKNLPSAQRDIIEKAFLGELSHSEIAVQTKLPLGTIKSRIRLGLEKLRHDLNAGSLK